MNSRERFIETVVNRNTAVHPLKWEFGYWGANLNNWYKEGLPRKNFAEVPTEYVDVSDSVFTYAWNSENKFVKPGEYPYGYALSGGNMPMGSQGFAIDKDVRDYFGMDEILQRVDINMFFDPMFEPYTVEETEDRLIYYDVDGAKRIYSKDNATVPTVLENPIKDWDSWNKLKDERLRLDRVMDRFGVDWKKKVEEYKNRTYPLTFNGFPMGYFGTLAHMIGYEDLFYMYYDEPELIHDILSHFTELWLTIFEEVLKDVEVDACHIWEDVSFGKGSMLPPSIMEEFMKPYYLRMTGFMKEHGINAIFVDTDGYCNDIIPFFKECGVTGMYPFETHCGMDVVKVREDHPDLILGGGISHFLVSAGKESIDKELKRLEPTIRGGGYIPFGDHFIPPDVHFPEFKYYRETLNEIIDSCGR